jgi:hypothetical protein
MHMHCSNRTLYEQSHILYVPAVDMYDVCKICDMNDIEEFEDTKGVIRLRILKKNRQHNGKEKGQKDKQQSTKHTHQTQDRVTRTPLITEGELKCYGRVNSSCFTRV